MRDSVADRIAFGNSCRAAHLYETGVPLPTTLVDSVKALAADTVITEILGGDAVNDLSVISMAEWNAFITTVTQWDYDRYLKIV